MSYLQHLRDTHPIACGSVRNGKVVRRTFYKFEDGVDVPYYQLDGESFIRRADNDEPRPGLFG